MKTSKRRTSKGKSPKKGFKPLMTEFELSRLGSGQIAYIRVLTPREAKALFPRTTGLPRSGDVFSLHAADGTPLVITDNLGDAQIHANDVDLEVAPLH